MISPEVLTVAMIGGFLVLVATGFHIALAIGGIALVVGYLLFGNLVGDVLYGRMFFMVHSYGFIAVPLFIYMGAMLERSGISEKLFDALYLWLSGLRGGLAIATVLFGTILAACVGIISASIAMLTIIALPAMLKRGYSKSLATGSICAGGCLGILIPPSIMLVIYGPMARLSVGKLFMAAVFPGLTLSFLYTSYIAIRSFFQPKIAPVVPVEERTVPLKTKTIKLVTSVVPIGIIILSVLGSIFMGIASPTEAAAVGSVAVTLLAVAYRTLNWQIMQRSAMLTLEICGMGFLIGACSFAFVGIFIGAGGGKVVEAAILAVPGGPWASFAVIMFIFFILGFVIDWIGILFIMVPIMAPIAPVLGFDPLWFGMMIIVNLQMSFMTPPMAGALFILKAAADPALGVTISDIIRGVFPFVGLVAFGLGLFIVFPQIILWLPSIMIK